MTTYSGVLNRRPFYQKEEASKYQPAAAKVKHVSVFKLNTVLILTVAIVIGSYIFMSNLLVAQKYALGLRKSELSQLNASLAAEGGENEDLKALFRFAQNSGLAEAQIADSIMEESNFAINRGRE